MTPATLGIALAALGCSSDDPGSDGTDPANTTGDGGGIGGSGGGGGDVSTGGTENLPPLPDDVTVPIVFVHGFAGSAQQFEGHLMRFVANGYPADRIYAYEHDGSAVTDYVTFAAGLDALVDQAMADHGTSQVFTAGHSRGGFVMQEYLTDPARAAKVAKYFSLDTLGCIHADPLGIECEFTNQTTLPGQAHVEVATSEESFTKMYELFVGQSPEVVEVVKQKGSVQISGRAVRFPENTGREGAIARFYEIDGATGNRIEDEPIDTFEIGPTGDWGPVTVSPDAHYEIELASPGYGSQHFYPQRFLRDDPFVRLLSQDPATSQVRANTNRAAGHSAGTVLRMREWYGIDDTDVDDGIDDRDILEISTQSDAGDEGPKNAIIPEVANGAIALHIHDDVATPGESSLSPLPWFDAQPFQYGIDVYMPASEPPNGTITFRNVPRGDTTRPQVINIPNWASDGHLYFVMFADYLVD